ncbi:MAG: uracil-DNA glycosylase [Paracoccaceae bacterium]
MAQALTRAELLAALEWQFELGADEAIGEVPLDRTESADAPAPDMALPVVLPAGGEPEPAVQPVVPAGPDPVAMARRAAGAAGDLVALREALAGYDHCELKKGARSLVFADGDARARVMVIGEAPGREEDLQGLPFVGRAGQLLDRMFAAIGLGRQGPDPEQAIYITNILPWRPPHNRDPDPQEIAMLLPFVERHVELVAPDLIVLMGNTPCAALLGKRGITRLRGQWAEVLGRPALPMFHPAYLLRQPHAKREAWADLLALRARLEGGR